MSELINEIEPDSGPMPPKPPPDGVWRRRFVILSHFLSGQLIVQGLNFLVGFLLLRWMDVNAFAQYIVAWSFQSTVGSLVDLGFTGSIIALVGDRADQPDIVGKYVRTARYFRIRSFFVVLAISVVAYPLAVRNQPWGWHVKALLFVGIAGGLAAQNLVMYASALLIARQLKPYYRAQITSSVFRQSALAMMHWTNLLTSYAASWVSAAAIAIYGFLYRRNARPYIREPLYADPAANREMLHYIAPQVPGIIFAAFQNQLTVALITIFGKTQSIAEVGALSRLSQIFLLASVFNSVVIEPYIARVSRDRLLPRYLQILGCQALLGLAFTSVAYFFPGVLLLLLGPKYANLQRQVVWVVAASSLEYLSLGFWVMNSARKWIYYWGTGLYIALLLGSQVIAACVFDMKTTNGVIYFDFVSNVAIVVVHIVTGTYGFKYGPAKRGQSDSPTPEAAKA